MRTPRIIILIFVTVGGIMAQAPELKAWRIIDEALKAGGEEHARALEMLPAIGDPKSQALVESILNGGNRIDIADLVPGFSLAESRRYLGGLAKAAESLGDQPRLALLNAIARAASPEAASVLSEIADRNAQPASGVAFGLLERMGSVAEPSLIKVITFGGTAWSRETAIMTLARIKPATAIPAFDTALKDKDERVRIAAALALAQLGNGDGMDQLRAAAKNSNGESSIQVLVALAALGQADAAEQLRRQATSSNEAVRGKTVWAMSLSGNPNLKRLAYELKLDRQPSVRNMIAEKLLDPNDEHDLAVLQEIIRSGDEVSRLIAARRLLRTKWSAIGEAAIGSALDSNDETTRHIALNAAAGYPPLREELARRLSSSDPSVQIQALSAIADLRETDRVSQVVPYTTSNVPAVSLSAARTLATLSPAKAKDVFVRNLDSSVSHVRLHSAAMLLAIDSRATPTRK